MVIIIIVTFLFLFPGVSYRLLVSVIRLHTLCTYMIHTLYAYCYAVYYEYCSPEFRLTSSYSGRVSWFLEFNDVTVDTILTLSGGKKIIRHVKL